MECCNVNVYLKAIGIGLISGLRSMAAPALVSAHYAARDPNPLDGSPLRPLATPGAAAALKLLAAGEVLADKTPWIPDRTSPPALVGRAASGAVVGAAVCAAEGECPGTGALAGCLAAGQR